MKCVATEDEVNVLMSGYAFRLRILHERGINSLKKQGMEFDAGIISFQLSIIKSVKRCTCWIPS